MNQEQIMQQLQAAVALHNQGELDQAEVIYRKVLDVDADNFYALNFCGCICREKKRFDEGIALLGRATSLQPVNPDAAYNLGNVFKDAERWDDAISCYEKALGLRAEYPEALSNLGICLKEVERYEHSEIVLRRAVSMQPGFAGAWLNLGNTFKEQEKFVDSVASYRKVIELKPDFADAYFNLGIVLKEEGEVEEAIASYRRAIELKPDFADAYFNLGIVLKEEGEVEEAIASYRRAIELKPDFADAYFNLGIVLKEEGEVEEAIASYRRAIELKPDFADAYFNLGIVLKEEGEVEEAIASYRRAIELKPDFADAYFNLGIVLKEEGEVEEAIASYRRAIELKPDFAAAYEQLATCLHEEIEFQDALTFYASALEADAQVSNCRFHLCVAGVESLGACFQALKSEFALLSRRTEDLIQEDLLFLRCISVFSGFYGMSLEYTIEFLQVCDPVELAPRHSPALREIFKLYLLYRKSLLPRWMHFKDIPAPLLLLSDYIEFLRVKCDHPLEDWVALKNYQLLSLASLDSEGLPSPSQLFVKEEDSDELMWLRAERFQFPETYAALSLGDSLLKKTHLPSASRQDQSEFFRKAHLLDAQKFYMADGDPCLHGVSELYRVHGLIADTIGEIKGLKGVVDLGYYSCGIFNAGLKADLKRYCIEPARHHAVWVAESGIAEVVPDVPERCVRSFEEYLSRLDAVALDDSGSTAAVISFTLQLFEYEQCVEILQRVKGFASRLVVADDILNEDSGESILRLLSHGQRMNLCHNYQRLLSDAGWVIEKKCYFHGVRYASGIIVASAA